VGLPPRAGHPAMEALLREEAESIYRYLSRHVDRGHWALCSSRVRSSHVGALWRTECASLDEGSLQAQEGSLQLEQGVLCIAELWPRIKRQRRSLRAGYAHFRGLMRRGARLCPQCSVLMLRESSRCDGCGWWACGACGQFRKPLSDTHPCPHCGHAIYHPCATCAIHIPRDRKMCNTCQRVS